MKRLLYILLAAAALLVAAAPLRADDPASGKKGKADEPIIEFTHRYMDLHLTMKLSKLKTFNKLLPMSLRREIGDEYYPEIRRRLTAGDTMAFKEGEASIERFEGGKIKLTMTFPNFFLVIRNATWEQVDQVFEEYF